LSSSILEEKSLASRSTRLDNGVHILIMCHSAWSAGRSNITKTTQGIFLITTLRQQALDLKTFFFPAHIQKLEDMDRSWKNRLYHIQRPDQTFLR
jgi:hypothetical protein